MLRALGITCDVDDEQDDDEDDDEIPTVTGAPGAFDDGGETLTPPPERERVGVWVDERLLDAWWDDHPAPGHIGGRDGALGLALVLAGAWRSVLDVAEVAVRTGAIDSTRLHLLYRDLGDDDALEGDLEVLWLSTTGPPELSPWEPIDWQDARDRAADGPTWRLAVRDQTITRQARRTDKPGAPVIRQTHADGPPPCGRVTR